MINFIIIDLSVFDSNDRNFRTIRKVVSNTNQLIDKVRKSNGQIIWVHYDNGESDPNHLVQLNLNVEKKDIHITKHNSDIKYDQTAQQEICRYIQRDDLTILGGFNYCCCVNYIHVFIKPYCSNNSIAAECVINRTHEFDHNLIMTDENIHDRLFKKETRNYKHKLMPNSKLFAIIR